MLLITLAVGAMATGAVVLSGNATAINLSARTQSDLEATALSGLAVGNAIANAQNDLVPQTGFRVLEDRVPAVDAFGATLERLHRTTYLARTGDTTGQSGEFWRLVAIAENPRGDRAIRSTTLTRQSFAQFAYFTNVEGNIWFGGGDVIRGPLHSNDVIRVHDTRATFMGPVTTAGTVFQPQFGEFLQGYQINQPRIELPTMRDIEAYAPLAAAGSTSFSGHNVGGAAEITLRIEFVTVNLNAATPGIPPEWHGYVRAFRLDQPGSGPARDWLGARRPAGGFRHSSNRNCGYWRNNGTQLVPIWEWRDVATEVHANTLCHLGGDPQLLSPALDQPLLGGRFRGRPSLANGGTSQNFGTWIRWNGPIPPRLRQVVGDSAAAYLIPMTDRSSNPNFKGVIYVNGRVAVSGELRGQVTLAATGSIVVVDDVRYRTPPGGETDCMRDRERDILGLLSGGDVIVSDNLINTPQSFSVGGTSFWRSFEPASEPHGADETIHGVVLALGSFTAENFSAGPTSASPCEGVAVGRGCLRLTGGIIQDTRGAVGTTLGTGYMKRYTYDTCAGLRPPPYYPSTGRFQRVGLFEHDPTNLDLNTLLR